MAIYIKKAIIHVLDKDSDEPVLNEFELNINDDIQAFLEKHITKSVGAEEARNGKFKEGMNVVKEASYKVFSDRGSFLESSKDIARQLFKAVKTNSSISSTDLVVCLYEDEDIPALAILKMDYTTSFIHDIEVVENKLKINIKKQDISLPGVNQRIQKCAFVLYPSLNDENELVILDNQISKGLEEPVAQFFLQTFLGAELIADSKACTKILKKETENWVKNKTKEGEPFAQEVREFVNSAIRKEDEIDIETFTNEIFGEKEDLKEEFVSNLRDKGIPNEKFEVDHEWVEKKLSKIKLKTNDNIEVVISYDMYSDKSKFEIISNSDGTKTIIIKGITALNQN